MALSINIKGLGVQTQNNAKGRKQSKLGAGLQHHQERFSEIEANEVMKSTESRIDPTQSKYNISFKKCEGSFYDLMSNTYEAVNEARIREGKRRMRSDANIGFMGTLQLSDDVLEASGFDKSKPWSENTSKSQLAVKTLYQYMFKHLKSRPDLYGFVESATLHVDESTPHVDFLTRAIDINDLDLNASKLSRGSKRGEKQRFMQDELAKDVQKYVIDQYGSEKGQRIIDQYHLVRGESGGSKRDKLIHLKEYEKKVNLKASEITNKDNALSIRENLLNEQEKKLKEREVELEEKEKRLKASERRLNELKENMDEREAKVSKMSLRASESLVEARKLLSDIEHSNEYKIGQVIGYARQWIRENRNYGTTREASIGLQGLDCVQTMATNKAKATGKTGNYVKINNKVNSLRKQVDKDINDLDVGF